MNKLLPVLCLMALLFAVGARADDRAVPVLQQVLQQLIIMNGKIDALNSKLDTINNRTSSAGNQERVFTLAVPGSFAKGPKEDGKTLCANLGGVLKGAYAYAGNIIVTCNY